MTVGMPLDGMGALVTGGAGGIGSACALRLAQDGAAVTIMGRTESSLKAAVEEMRAHLKRIELAQWEHEGYISGHDEFDEQDEQLEEDALSLESAEAAAERARQFAVIAELFTAAELGTS